MNFWLHTEQDIAALGGGGFDFFGRATLFGDVGEGLDGFENGLTGSGEGDAPGDFVGGGEEEEFGREVVRHEGGDFLEALEEFGALEQRFDRRLGGGFADRGEEGEGFGHALGPGLSGDGAGIIERDKGDELLFGKDVGFVHEREVADFGFAEHGHTDGGGRGIGLQGAESRGEAHGGGDMAFLIYAAEDHGVRIKRAAIADGVEKNGGGGSRGIMLMGAVTAFDGNLERHAVREFRVVRDEPGGGLFHGGLQGDGSALEGDDGLGFGALLDGVGFESAEPRGGE